MNDSDEGDLDDTTCDQEKRRLYISLLAQRNAVAYVVVANFLRTRKTVFYERQRRHLESAFQCLANHTLPLYVMMFVMSLATRDNENVSGLALM